MSAIDHQHSPARSRFLVALLAGFLAFAGSTNVHAQVSAEERQALIRLYHATGGDEWEDTTSWLAEAGSECNWFGVQCAGRQSGTPFVFQLTLSDNNLVGQLPDSLAELDRLASLVVSDNELTGSISPDLWGLSSLAHLSLRQNQFSGPVPAVILTMTEGMPGTSVNLSGNMLDGFDTGPIPDPPLGREIDLALNDNLFESLPPVSWRAAGVLGTLEMANNRIAGTLDLSSDWPELEQLDLSGNAITGIEAPDGTVLPDLIRLNLAGNEFADWPDLLPTLTSLVELDLSDSGLSGGLPEWFADLDLAALDLDNNELTGPIADVFPALDLDDFPDPGPHGDLGLRLHVANNRFSGALPDIDYTKFNSPFQGQSPDFGLDLCFNDIEMPDTETLEAINPVHRGLALQPCIRREQAGLDATISGSWYQPQRSGEGVTLMLLDNGQLLNYWFTFAPSEQEDDEPEQMWLVEVTEPADSYAEFRPMWIAAGGRFGQGLSGGSARPSPTWVRQNRIDDDTLHFFYDHRGGGICITGACFWDVLTGRFDQTRLSQLAGTTCDNQSPYQQYAGAWYNPERSGEGFVVEVLPDNRIVVYWFTYQPDDSGRQAWMVGSGAFRDPGLILDPPPPFEEEVELTLHQPVGTAFGPQFDPAEVEAPEWGELVIRFNDENSGEVLWNSNMEGYGSGEYDIERLAQPVLADCGSGENTESPFPIDSGNLDDAPGRYKGLPLTLTDNGQPQVSAEDGRIGMVCIGMSNAYQECEKLVQGIEQVWSDEISDEIELVNCALGGHAIERWNDPAFDAVLWEACDGKIEQQGMRPDQIRVVLHKAANQFTTDDEGQALPPYPSPDSDYFRFKDNLDTFAERVTGFFPTLQAVFTTSRSYGGFSTRPARGEPIGYEEGHALNQWLTANEFVNQVWFGWGPYIWAPRCDSGITNGYDECYVREDFEADGIHPAAQGEIKIATMWHERLLEFDWYSSSQSTRTTAASPR